MTQSCAKLRDSNEGKSRNLSNKPEVETSKTNLTIFDNF